MPLRNSVRRMVIDRAAGRCEYCQIDGWPLTIDHIVPVAAWRAASGQPATGPDDPSNLAAACFPCNRAKSNATTGHDALTDTVQPLFNPRQHLWDEHFAWLDDYLEVVGITPMGRATMARLRLNREVYQRQRRLLRASARAGGPAWPWSAESSEA